MMFQITSDAIWARFALCKRKMGQLRLLQKYVLINTDHNINTDGKNNKIRPILLEISLYQNIAYDVIHCSDAHHGFFYLAFIRVLSQASSENLSTTS